jgi:sulfonate transport system permease protein
MSRGSAATTVVMPAPSAVLRSLLSSSGAEIAVAGWQTSKRAVLGFGVAVVFGVALGTLISTNRVARALLIPYVESLRPLPSTALIPVAILLLGIGEGMKLTVVIIGSVWPIVVGSMESIAAIEGSRVDTMRALRLSWMRAVAFVILPAALPGILGAVRVALAIALILALTVEMVAGSGGLGFYIISMERAFRLPEMYAAIVAAGAIGAVLSAALRMVSIRLLRWHGGSHRLSES